MTGSGPGSPPADLAKLLQATELVRAGLPVPPGMPAPKRLDQIIVQHPPEANID